jgi:hypothetical protein
MLIPLVLCNSNLKEFDINLTYEKINILDYNIYRSDKYPNII